MKRGWKEGWLIAAALIFLLALSLFLWLDRQPRTQFVAPVHSASLEDLERAGQIDLNTAGVEELEELPGIGPVLAGAIVAYREEWGPFRSVEELLNVSGIGPAKLEAVRPFLRLY